jgi:hypothetical protein
MDVCHHVVPTDGASKATISYSTIFGKHACPPVFGENLQEPPVPLLRQKDAKAVL